MLMPSPARNGATDHSWQFFYRPRDAWEAMYADCLVAKHSIEFEQYILEKDAVGEHFLKLFIQKASQGVRVMLICDTFGSSKLNGSKLMQEFRKQGGTIHFYNPIKGWKVLQPWHWFPRTHIKTLLIDSEIAYTGGVCLAERMNDWRDTHVRVTGPVVQEIRAAFDDIEGRIARRHDKKAKKRQKIRDFFYLMNRPRRKRHAIYRAMTRAVREAKEQVLITSAYFIPNHRFIQLLKRASARGVEVKVLVPEISDVLMADWLRLSYSPAFLRAGVRLFHYQRTVLHSKTAIVDSVWATVGSTNFDVISFFHNREANVVITDADAIAELKRQFEADLLDSTEFTWEDWKRVPLWKKFAGFAVRSIKVFFG